jgi:flagellin
MALVVNSNIASLTAQNHLSANRREMETAMERLSSGKRINTAADDAAGLAISTRMDAQVRGLTKAVQNANDGISLVQTASGAQKEITEMLQRMRELAVQASNTTNNALDRTTLDAEVTQLIQEIDLVAQETRFNDQVLLNGSYTANIQTGYALGQELGFSIANMQTGALGLANSTTAGGVDTLISGRVDLDVANTQAISEGDVLINGQDLGAVAAANEIADVVNNINTNISGVTASAFNEVVMYDVGTGIADANDIMISVQNVGATSSGTTTDQQMQAFMINEASHNLTDLVRLINEKVTGATASINGDGKLVLSNDTGASIGVKDLSSGAKATGLTDGADIDESQAAASDAYNPATATTTVDTRYFNGFLKMVSDDGSQVRVQKGHGADGNYGTQADLDALGLMQVGVNEESLGTTYSVQGDRVVDADATVAFNAGDLKINGVDVFNDELVTTTLQGKLDAINAKKSETGVSASSFFERFYDASTLTNVNGTVTLTYGTKTETFELASTLATVYANLSAGFTSGTLGASLSAELIGDVIRIYGDDVTNVSITLNGTNAAIANNRTLLGGADGAIANSGHTAQNQHGAIQLESTGSSAISIDLGEDAPATGFGLLEANVGAADFDSNTPTSIASGGLVSDLSISTVAGANSAITAIDNALEQVTASAANLGAMENRLDHVIANVSETIVNTEAAKSRIMDADFAVESAKLAKQQVLQQAASAMLAQANAAPQSVLSLLGG